MPDGFARSRCDVQLELAIGVRLFVHGRHRMRTAKRERDVQWYDDDGRIHCTDVREMRDIDDGIGMCDGRGVPMAHTGVQYAAIADGRMFSRR
jgi:hypothetical protein